MSAEKENSLEGDHQNDPGRCLFGGGALGVIAGGGEVPRYLLQSCDKKDIRTFLVALDGQADTALTDGREHITAPLGAAGYIIKTLQNRDIRDLVLIGAVRRPSFTELKPDIKTAGLLTKIGLSLLGDDGLLKAIRKELEHEGFRLHGVHEIAPDLLAQEGVIGRYKPSGTDRDDIAKGFEAARQLGYLDIGQSVIVQNGIILGVEAAEGTDALIKRSGGLKRKGGGGVLVKRCKPQQDKDLDLPTIGPNTVRECAAAGLAGIAVHAGQSLVFDIEEIKKQADKHRIFVTAVDPEKL